jgi:NADH dehydrogenase
LFYPALYATATGHSKRESIIPLTKIFARGRVKIVKDTIISIDTARKIVVGKENQLSYDRIIFSLGVVTSYFGIAGLDTYSYSIKSADELTRFKKHLHDELTENGELDKNYVIVGAGPTGVELSAALAHYLRRIAENHNIRNPHVSLNLVEAAPRVLPRMSERASKLVARELGRVGVRVMTNKKVESEDDDSIMISGKDVPSKTVVWTSGVTNHPFFAEHNDIFRLAKNGRVEVDEHLRANDKHVYVIGDNAATPYTGLAQTAIHDAKFVARAIKAEVHHRSLPRYSPKKQPVVVPVGERWAIFEFGPFRLTGLIGALITRAANFVGYLDYFPVWTSINLWQAGGEFQEECTSCQ